jgi:hypothetical protein
MPTSEYFGFTADLGVQKVHETNLNVHHHKSVSVNRFQIRKLIWIDAMSEEYAVPSCSEPRT